MLSLYIFTLRNVEMKLRNESIKEVLRSERTMGNHHHALTVEPVTLLYISALLLQLPTYQHYLYHRAQLHLAQNASDIANVNHCNKNVTSLDKKIQQQASKYILSMGLASTFPAIFSSLIYGPLSDRKGRTMIMRLPPLGSLIDVSITLATIYLELPVYVMTIGSAISGISGQYITLVFTVTAYIADTTANPAKLSVRLTQLEAIALLGGTIAQATSGLWIEHLGYAAPYWFMFSCHLTSFLYVTFWLPESHQKFSKHAKNCYSLKDLKLLAGVIIKIREHRGRLKLSFLFIASAMLLVPAAVINQLVILYSKDTPLCWKLDFIGYFLASLFFARAVGAVLCMKFLKWFDWKDYSIAQVGTIFVMGLLVMIGLSTTTLQMFLSTVFGLCIGLPKPCLSAQMSHIVDLNEQGSLFSILASIESLCNFLANIVFNPLYQLSLHFTWKHGNGFVFFINSGITLVPFIIISTLKVYHNRRKGCEPIQDNTVTSETVV